MDLRARSAIERVRSEGRRFVTEPEAKEILRAYGVPVTKDQLCHSQEETVEAANGIGYPVVMKLVSKQVVHKTELGAVRLAIGSDEAVRSAFVALEEKAREAKLSFEGVLVSETATGLEMVIGSVRDVQFGQMIMVGMGGIFVEVYKDVSYRIVPVEEVDVLEMISELHGAKLLQGHRDRGKADVKALVKAVLGVSDLLADFDCISEMDLNPIFVGAKGAKVADARIILS